MCCVRAHKILVPFSRCIRLNHNYSLFKNLTRSRLRAGTTACSSLLFLFSYERDSANACPHYQKLCARATPIWGSRRSQPVRSAMHRPRPGGTAFMITVSPAPGKYEREKYAFFADKLCME